MDVDLAIIALCCLLLALGQIAIGLLWVLPNLTAERWPATPFGPPALTLGIVRFCWHIVSVILVAFAILFMLLSAAPDADPRTLLLRWFAAVWLAALVTAGWTARHRPGDLLRFPVAFAFPVIVVLSWTAST